MKNTSNHPETEKPAHASLSFDGCGINGRDEYRTRIATFTDKRGPVAQHYGPLFAAAPEMFAALVKLSKADAIKMPSARDADELLRELADVARAAIARANGQK